MSIHDFEIHRKAMISWLFHHDNSVTIPWSVLDTTSLAQQINKQYPGGWAAFVHDQDKRYQEVTSA